MNNQLLNIGSVVMLKEGKHKLMIIGYYATSEENSTKIYDYMGCFYPEGTFTLERVILFNRTEIQTVYHQGYNDEDNEKYKKQLEVLKNKYIDSSGNLTASPETIIKNETSLK